MKHKWIFGTVLLALAMAFSPGAKAQITNYYWNNTTGGNFLDGDNWNEDTTTGTSGVVPGVGKRAYFYKAGSLFTVNLTDDHEVGRLNMLSTAGASDVRIDLGGNTLTVSDDVGYNLRFSGSSDGSGNRTLRIANGTFNAVSIYGGPDDLDGDARGILHLEDGANVTIAHVGTDDKLINLGIDSRAELRVSTGATLTYGTAADTTDFQAHVIGSVGAGNGEGHGFLYVDGGTVDFGAANYRIFTDLATENANGTMEVTNGGTVKELAFLRVGRNGTGTGTLLVDGANSSLETNRMNIAAGLSTGTVTVSNGGTITVGGLTSQDTEFEANATVNIDGGELTLGGDDSLNWESGATYHLTLHHASDTPLETSQDVDLNADTGTGAVFELSMADGLAPGVGDVFTVLDYSGGTLSGTFDGLADGDIVTDTESGAEFEIYYNYNSEDRIALLTTIPEPHSLGMILLGLASVALRRRLRMGDR